MTMRVDKLIAKLKDYRDRRRLHRDDPLRVEAEADMPRLLTALWNEINEPQNEQYR